MNGWIIYNEQDYKRNVSFVDILKKEGDALNIKFELLFVENITFGTDGERLFFRYNNQDIKLPDFVISRTIYPLLSKHLELMGTNVYNNSLVCDICNDKAKTYQYISENNIKIVPTTFVKREYISYFLNYGAINKNSVIKTTDGHGGKEVFLYNNINDNTSISELNKDIVYQPKIDGLGCDLRVYIVGNEIISSVLRTSKNGFKSNFSLGGNVELYELNKYEKDIVNKVIYAFYKCNPYKISTRGLSFVGIDFIIDKDKNMLFNEVEDVVGSRMLYKCSDINIVKLYLEYIKNSTFSFS